MNKKIPFSASLVLMLISALLTFQIVTIFEEAKYDKIVDSFTVKPIENPKLAEINAIVEKNYVKDIDEEYLNSSIIYGYIWGLGDIHADYYTAEEFREFTERVAGNLTGIGIRVALELLDGNTQRVTVFEVMKNSPAEKAGVMAGDILYSIEGTLFSELGYSAAMDKILGEAGTTVTFEVMRRDRVIEFKITRSDFEAQLVSYKMIDEENAIGYVRVYQFGESSVSQFINAVEDLRHSGANSIVFDMRNNPGGEYNTIVKILDYLLPEGPIVTIEDKAGNRTTETSNEECVDIPMVVLANEDTASAAELFTAALLDYEKAIMIGTTTYGKGTAQNTFPLSDGSAIKLSTCYYLPPSGVSFDGIGIKPTEEFDIPLNIGANENMYLIDESRDNQLVAALNHLKTLN